MSEKGGKSEKWEENNPANTRIFIAYIRTGKKTEEERKRQKRRLENVYVSERKGDR